LIADFELFIAGREATLRNSIRLAAAAIIAAVFMSQSGRAEPVLNLADALVRYAKLDYMAAHRMLSPLADDGDAVAQEILGFMYSRAEGIPRDDAVAFHWFTLAAEAGRTEAQFELGRIYRDGAGVTADGQTALFWFRRAADQGKPDAYNAVAELYLGQHGIPADPAAAAEWFLRGAEHGSAQAMYNIGLRYAQGQGVARDEVEALKWFDLAHGEAVGSLHDTIARARVALSEQLMPMQVQMAQIRSREWTRTHRE
jgi:TPR repeat protein